MMERMRFPAFVTRWGMLGLLVAVVALALGAKGDTQSTLSDD